MTTSRERVMITINHREPDRVPIDLSGHRSSGIMAIAYNKLKQHLGITSGDIYVYDFVQQLAIVEPEVLDRFGVDTVELGRGFALKPEDWRDWVLPDGTPCKIPAFIEPVQGGRRLAHLRARRHDDRRAERGQPLLRADVLPVAGLHRRRLRRRPARCDGQGDVGHARVAARAHRLR